MAAGDGNEKKPEKVAAVGIGGKFSVRAIFPP